MKKILFSLVALVASMSMNAQVMKNGEEVAKDHAYDGSTQLGDIYGITVNYTK